MRLWKIFSTTLLFTLTSACSHPLDTSGAAPPQEDCAASPTDTGGYLAECRHGFTYNGKSIGSVLFTHSMDPSRGCNDYQSSATIDGTADTEPGEVRATLDDSSGKISYAVDSAEVTILLDNQKDWLWVRSSVAGAAADTDKKVYCPGLEEAAARRAKAMGLGSSVECPGSDPHHVDLGEFICSALEQEIKARDAHKVMSAPGKLYKMAAGKVLVTQAERLAMQSGAGTKRAAVLPVLGVIFTALGTVFSSKEFQTAFDPQHKTDSANGP